MITGSVTDAPGDPEGCCEEICPGDLFYREQGKAVMREPSDCWDCCACVKACPRAALSIELPFQISEAKHRLTARIKKNTDCVEAAGSERKNHCRV